MARAKKKKERKKPHQCLTFILFKKTVNDSALLSSAIFRETSTLRPLVIIVLSHL